MSKQSINYNNEREIRVLVISMGGPRQEAMEQMLAEIGGFAKPVFSPGIPSRRLNNRSNFFQTFHQAGLLPPAEWEKLQPMCEHPPLHGRGFFECLQGVPISPDRRGSPADVKLHYCDELWRKAKTINRGKSVLACILAHLIALQTFVQGDFDVLLEDNVRAPLETGEAARLIRDTILAARKSEQSTGGNKVHMKYFGWLGSRLNLQWTFQSHFLKRRLGPETTYSSADESAFVAMFPTTQHVEQDLESGSYTVHDKEKTTEILAQSSSTMPENAKVHDKPGGTPVWGAYAYWMSKEAYENVLDVLRKDIGALLWKTKSARFYTVKPIDKILPRHTFSTFGESSAVIASQPAFFRAPMLTSKIHAQWDSEFCQSTEYQLVQTKLSWSSLWLTESEQLVVHHRERTGEWVSPNELQAKSGEESTTKG